LQLGWHSQLITGLVAVALVVVMVMVVVVVVWRWGESQLGGAGQAWSRELSGRQIAVLLFNRADTPRTMSADFGALGLGKDAKMRVRDVILKKDLGVVAGSVGGEIAPHAVLFVVLSRPTAIA